MPALYTGVSASIAPPSSVVSLMIKFNDVGQTCAATGAFIDATHILTAADQFYNTSSWDNDHFPDQVDVLAGRNGSYSSADGQVYHASRVDFLPGYLANVGRFGASDLALVTVNPSPYLASSFYFTNNADQVGYGPLTIYSAGYPNDSYFGTDGATPYWTVGSVSGVDTQTAPDGTPLLTWHNYARNDGNGLSLYMGGQNGSPLYWFDPNNHPIIVGVYVSGTAYTGTDGQQHVSPTGTGYATALTSYAATWINSILNGGNSGAGTHSIPVPPAQTGTYTDLTASADTIQVGSWVSFTATINSPGSPTAPTGTVTFYDNGYYLGQLGVQTFFGTTSATLYTDQLSPGSHTITASYSGDASHWSSFAWSVNETVNPVQTNAPPAASGGASTLGVRTVRVKGHQQVVVYDTATRAERFRLLPFGRSFKGRLRAALQGLDGDGTPELLVTAVVKGRRAAPDLQRAHRRSALKVSRLRTPSLTL